MKIKTVIVKKDEHPLFSIETGELVEKGFTGQHSKCLLYPISPEQLERTAKMLRNAQEYDMNFVFFVNPSKNSIGAGYTETKNAQ